MKRKSRPCGSCGRWFRPDPRLGVRQRTCGAPDCQTKRRRKLQRQWRERNPAYFTERRLGEQLAGAAPSTSESASATGQRAASGRPQSPSRGVGAARAAPSEPSFPRPPPLEMGRIPWSLVQSTFGPQIPVLIAFLLRVLRPGVQFTIQGKSRVASAGSEGMPARVPQSATDAFEGVT